MNNYPYRKGVNAVVIDNNNNYLLVQKKLYGDNQWDFPGGGIENGETPKTAILRELKEELGSESFKILEKSPIKIKFEWPQTAIEDGFKKHGKWYRGQEKTQFIIRFTGKKEELTIQENEIKKIKWVKYNDLQTHLVFDGQWENAEKVINNSKLIQLIHRPT